MGHKTEIFDATMVPAESFPLPAPSLTEIWKGHAEVWRSQSDAEALDAHLCLGDRNNEQAARHHGFAQLCKDIAERYEAKAKESEG